MSNSTAITQNYKNIFLSGDEMSALRKIFAIDMAEDELAEIRNNSVPIS